MIQAKDDRGADGGRNGPHEADSKPDPFMILVAGVLYRLSHGNVPENCPIKQSTCYCGIHLAAIY